MAMVNTDRLLATFLDLVRIDSPTGQEADVAAYCIKALQDAGCVINSNASSPVPGSNSNNVIATLPAYSGQNASASLPGPIFFSAHMDTVEPGRGVEPIIKDGVVYSDGSTILGSDDKVGLAAIIEMIRSLGEGQARGEEHPEIRVLFTVQEEVGLLGAYAMKKEEFSDVQGALCYVLDAAGKPGLVVNGAPFHHSYRAVFKGRPSHAGIAPEAGISAIKAAAEAICALPQGRLDDESTCNIGTIQGGSADNVVPAECIVTGELRSQSKECVEALQAEIDGILKANAAQEVSVQWTINYEGFFAPEDSPQVQLALHAARQLGFETRTEVSNGGADTNVFASYGLAAVSLGSGMERVHSTEECLAIVDLEKLTRLILCIVEESCGDGYYGSECGDGYYGSECGDEVS